MKKVLFWSFLLILIFIFADRYLFEVEEKAKDTMVVEATAYYGPLKGQSRYATGSYEGDIRLNGRGIKTFSGEPVEVGHIAADWTILPQGTVVYIPGYGEGIVEDIGGAIKGNRIDLFMGHGEEALEKALQWGRREVEIQIIKWGNGG